MRRYFYLLFLVIGFWGCSSPSEFKVPNSEKNVDEYSRQFIKNIIDGNTEGAITMISPEFINEDVKEFITNTSQNINHEEVKNVKVVEYATNTTYFNSRTIINYKFSYEYIFDKGNILFFTTLKKENEKLLISGFGGQFLPVPLSELTHFSLSNKTLIHYIFFLCCIIIPLFILMTFVFMLFSKMSVKQKIIWGIVIILVSFPRFLINWGTAEIEFKLLNLCFLGAGYSRINLYSSWILAFNIPIGAIFYWIRHFYAVKQKNNNLDKNNI